MSGQNPLVIALTVGVTALIGKLWWDDLQAQRKGNPNPRALPGTSTCSVAIALIGVFGAVFLVILETIGEYALGISDRQSDITELFLASMLCAGFIEEIVFRGFLVIDQRGRHALVLSIVGFSALFALLHFHWIRVPEGKPWWNPQFAVTAEAGWWTLVLFLNSLWFYWLRFNSRNPNRSLLPSIAAHVASNLAVFAVKAMQGHVSGLI